MAEYRDFSVDIRRNSNGSIDILRDETEEVLFSIHIKEPFLNLSLNEMTQLKLAVYFYRMLHIQTIPKNL